MSITVATFEARNKLSQLIERAAKGEVITITRHGIPIAKIVPASGVDRDEARRAVKEWVKLRVGNRLGRRISTRDLIDEGRR